MGQLLVRQLDDVTIKRLKIAARERRTSVGAIARAAQLTVDEKQAMVAQMHAWSEQANVPGAPQTGGTDLIREHRQH